MHHHCAHLKEDSEWYPFFENGIVPTRNALLCWKSFRFQLELEDPAVGFSISPSDQLFDAEGRPHGKYSDFSAYASALLLRSTDILYRSEAAQTVLLRFPIPFSMPDGAIPSGPEWPHTHTLEVAKDDVFAMIGQRRLQIVRFTIGGFLYWERDMRRPQHHVIQHVDTGEVFAGALVCQGGIEGQMTALVFSPESREIGIQLVRLAEKHLNSIRRLQMQLQSSAERFPPAAVHSSTASSS